MVRISFIAGDTVKVFIFILLSCQKPKHTPSLSSPLGIESDSTNCSSDVIVVDEAISSANYTVRLIICCCDCREILTATIYLTD